MPLHRGIHGDRGRLDDRALRATSEGRLPPGLDVAVRLLEPDAEVADLYRGVPLLDDEGILRRMLENERPHRFVAYIMDALGYAPTPKLRPDHGILPRDSTRSVLC